MANKQQDYICGDCWNIVKFWDKKCKKCKAELVREQFTVEKDIKEQKENLTIEEKEEKFILEKEKQRTQQEKYNTKILWWWWINIFLITLFLTFIIWIITLIKERDLQYRYYEYKAFFRIFIWTIILYWISNSIEENRKKTLELKPSEQFEKFKYENDYLYTDQKKNLFILYFHKNNLLYNKPYNYCILMIFIN